jgi:hypothetical protein
MGFAAGFSAGSQAVERALQRKKEEELQQGLSKAYSAPESYVDYTPAQTKEIQGLQTSGGYDVQAIPSANGAAPTLRYATKEGLDLQGDSPVSFDISPQQVQRYAGQTVAGEFDPMRLRALQSREAARVTGLSGDARGAAQLFQQAEDADYNAQRRPLELQSLRQQGELSAAQLSQANRTERTAKLEEDRQKENAEWWTSRTTNEDGSRRAPKPEDFLAASQRDASSYFQTGDYNKGGQAYDAFMNRAEAQINKDEKERKRESELAFAAVQKGDFKAGMAFYNKFLPNGSIATEAVEGKDGKITVKHTDLSGNKLPDTKITRQELLQGIASFGDSKQALAYIQQSFMNNIQTQELGLKGQSVALQKRSVENQEDATQASKILGLQNLQLNKDRLNKPSPQTVKQFKDAKTGESVLVDVSRLEVGKDGVLKTPKGLIAVNAKTEPTDASVVRQATEIMADRRNYKMVGGKLVPPTMAEATAMAKANLRKQSAADGSEDDSDRIIRLMEAARAANAVDSGLD